jgi:hypothetical protein
MDDSVREWIKVAAGGAGAFVGGLLMRVGWKRAKAPSRTVLRIPDDSEPALRGRTITSKEWHELRDRIHRAEWEIDRIKRELGIQ